MNAFTFIVISFLQHAYSDLRQPSLNFRMPFVNCRNCYASHRDRWINMNQIMPRTGSDWWQVIRNNCRNAVRSKRFFIPMARSRIRRRDLFHCMCTNERTIGRSYLTVVQTQCKNVSFQTPMKVEIKVYTKKCWWNFKPLDQSCTKLKSIFYGL